jgi:hypothetical protein
MHRRPDEIVARARALIGARFRPQGRTFADGLDCIGLVAMATDGRNAPCDYALRGCPASRLEEELVAAGLAPVATMAAGDVLVLAPRRDQIHLGVFTGIGLVHADAGLRRVVERPLPLPWPILGIWRP